MKQLINPVYFENINVSRGTLIEVHIADIHFGVIDPKEQYKILEEQFLDKIDKLRFDIISINGDLFDHKFMSNSDAVMYAIKFVDRIASRCIELGATMVLLHGTMSHDANQLKLFYNYLENPYLDIRIVETVQFQYIKGAKILCIPELYGKGENYYNEFLLTQEYDSVFMHGTIKGSVYGANKEDLNTDKSPVFDISSFGLCRGPIIAGHVHKPGCFETYMYYCGSPIRFAYGEEESKGFIVLLHNLDTREHYVHFEEIKSFRYDTINLDHMIMSDPKDVIAYLKQLQDSGIDNIRVEFTQNNEENLNILRNYYKNNSNIKIHLKLKDIDRGVQIDSEQLKKYDEYNYIIDQQLSPYEILTRYINDNKGYHFISTEELINILSNE